jgi:hypothetical protein
MGACAREDGFGCNLATVLAQPSNQGHGERSGFAATKLPAWQEAQNLVAHRLRPDGVAALKSVVRKLRC